MKINLRIERIIAFVTSRALILNARTAMEMAPTVAELMMNELAKNKKWKKDQIDSFNKLAGKYILAAP